MGGNAGGRLAGKVTAITGAASGIGKASAGRVRAMLDPDSDPIARKSLMRPMEPRDIGHLALYLAGEESPRITGAILPAESGVSAH